MQPRVKDIDTVKGVILQGVTEKCHLNSSVISTNLSGNFLLLLVEGLLLNLILILTICM